jgi:hypothetical protein
LKLAAIAVINFLFRDFFEPIACKMETCIAFIAIKDLIAVVV